MSNDSSQDQLLDELNALFGIQDDNDSGKSPAMDDKPNLARYGRNLTARARDGKIGEILGRDSEIQLVVETLFRRTKRNPALVGPAGCGKTAIIEGLARRVARGEVPEELRQVEIIEIQPSVLVAGASHSGELEERVKAIIAEASDPNVILFIDEVHSIVGAGGASGSSDIASILKPSLARGELACIGATTQDEYRRYIEADAALERRFQPIRVHELGAEQTRVILRAVRNQLVKLRGVDVPDEVLDWLVAFAAEYLRNRYFPDKAIDLLEQSVAYAVTQGRNRIEASDATFVAQRLVGMPVDLGERLESLRQKLSALSLLTNDDSKSLLNRLDVTMRGLDIRPNCPNATILLTGEAQASAESLAATLAEHLYGGSDRVVVIDCSRFIHPADVSMLVGAPPGYLGHKDTLPLHRLLQIPHSVLRLDGVHACHPQVREVITKMLAEGSLVDSTGRRIFLSDTVVLLTADISTDASRTVGFGAVGSAGGGVDVYQAVERAMGPDFAAQIDLVFEEAATKGDVSREWLEQTLLTNLADRFAKRGLRVSFTPSLVDWLATRECKTRRDWERLVDNEIGAVLVDHLPAPGAPGRAVVVRYSDAGSIEVSG